MSDARRAELENIAAGLKEPGRARNVKRYHRALLETMNRTTDPDGTQDPLEVCEAVAMLIGQIVGSFDVAEELVEYIAHRAVGHGKDAARAGTSAMFVIERESGKGGH